MQWPPSTLHLVIICYTNYHLFINLDEKFALLLLNTPLQSIQKLFTRLWNTGTSSESTKL